jgi:hypothetical protein
MKTFHASPIRRAATQMAIFVPLYAILAIGVMNTPTALALVIAFGGGLGVVAADVITTRQRSAQKR